MDTVQWASQFHIHTLDVYLVIRVIETHFKMELTNSITKTSYERYGVSPITQRLYEGPVIPQVSLSREVIMKYVVIY